MFVQESVYTRRSRKDNLDIVKALLEAPNKQEFDKALERLRGNYHPSIFAELDYWISHCWLNERGRLDYEFLLEKLFLDNLEEIVRKRSFEIPNDKEALAFELRENGDFFAHIVRKRPEILINLSNLQKHIISSFIDSKGQNTNDLGPRTGIYPYQYELEGYTLFEKLRLAKNKKRVITEIENALTNSFLFYQDKMSSRLRTKYHFRQENFNYFINYNISADPTFKQLYEFLSGLRTKAANWNLWLIDLICKKSLEFFEQFPILSLPESDSSLISGLGPCGNCAMFFASSGISSFSDRSFSFSEDYKDWTYIPSDLNTAKCPFCGSLKRISLPFVFHSFKRNQVIFHIPEEWIPKKEEALRIFGEPFKHIYEEYKKNLSEDDKKFLQNAQEIIAYGWSEFYLAVQTSEPRNIAHTTVSVEIGTGNNVIIDTPNKVVIGVPACDKIKQGDDLLMETDLIARMINALFTYNRQNLPLEIKEQLAEKMAVFEETRFAIAFFKSGDIKKAKDILERLFLKYPEDKYIAYNLAIALAKEGEKKRAIEILRKLENEKWNPLS
jgi:hypothetical protein